MGMPSVYFIFGIFCFYAMLAFGVSELYHETNPLQENLETQVERPENGGIFDTFSGIVSSVTSVIGIIWGIVAYQNPHIPAIVNYFIVTPLNFFMVISAILWIRGS